MADPGSSFESPPRIDATSPRDGTTVHEEAPSQPFSPPATAGSSVDAVRRPEDVTHIKTLYVSGFPADIKYREVKNLFRFFPGFEHAVLNLKGNVSRAFFGVFGEMPFLSRVRVVICVFIWLLCLGKAPVVFATFTTADEANNAKGILQGVKFDEETQPHIELRVQIARANSQTTGVSPRKQRHNGMASPMAQGHLSTDDAFRRAGAGGLSPSAPLRISPHAYGRELASPSGSQSPHSRGQAGPSAGGKAFVPLPSPSARSPVAGFGFEGPFTPGTSLSPTPSPSSKTMPTTPCTTLFVANLGQSTGCDPFFLLLLNSLLIHAACSARRRCASCSARCPASASCASPRASPASCPWRSSTSSTRKLRPTPCARCRVCPSAVIP